MFAYCGNNPVNFCDHTGNCVCGSGTVLRGDVVNSNRCTSCGYGGGTIGSYIGFNLIDQLKEATAALVVAWTVAQASKAEFDNHSVYVLIDPADNLVKYVGRTNDSVRRANEHRHYTAHPWRQEYIMDVKLTGLDLKEAMLWEQVLISAYSLSYLENARREIAVKNIPKYRTYLNAVSELITGIAVDDIYQMITGR